MKNKHKRLAHIHLYGIAAWFVLALIGPGIYSGNISGSIFIICEFEGHGDGYRFSLKAESESRWYWSEPANFKYSTMEFDDLDRRQPATVDLKNNCWRRGDEKGSFSAEDMMRLVFYTLSDDLNERENVAPILDELRALFKALSEGKAQRPRHHYISFEGELKNLGHYRHIANSYNFGYLGVFLWLVIMMPVLVIGSVLRTRAVTRPGWEYTLAFVVGCSVFITLEWFIGAASWANMVCCFYVISESHESESTEIIESEKDFKQP